MRPRSLRAGIALPVALLGALPAAPAAAAPNGITLTLQDTVVGHGRSVVATGRVAGAAGGRTVVLQAQGADGAWAPVTTARTAADGGFRLRAPLQRSARVRVVERTDAAAAGESPVAFVTVVARVASLRRRTDVLAGQAAFVRGTVRPAVAGLRVRLQRRAGGRWITVDTATTRAGGRFAVSRRLGSLGAQRMRLTVGRTPLGIAGTTRDLGKVEAFRRALASWYGPGLYGNALGCGGRLQRGTVGVAHKRLPCGTNLTLRYRGREVRAEVIDRGPYAGAREFDLTAATKARLGFGGVGTILVSY